MSNDIILRFCGSDFWLVTWPFLPKPDSYFELCKASIDIIPLIVGVFWTKFTGAPSELAIIFVGMAINTTRTVRWISVSCLMTSFLKMLQRRIRPLIGHLTLASPSAPPRQTSPHQEIVQRKIYITLHSDSAAVSVNHPVHPLLVDMCLFYEFETHLFSFTSAQRALSCHLI